VVYGPGDSLLVATRRHVAKSSLFLLVGSPDLLVVRQPVDWIEREIDASTSVRPSRLGLDPTETVGEPRNESGRQCATAFSLKPLPRPGMDGTGQRLHHRLYDRRKSKPEDSPTFHVKY
jgi:hypothetical protein